MSLTNFKEAVREWHKDMDGVVWFGLGERERGDMEGLVRRNF